MLSKKIVIAAVMAGLLGHCAPCFAAPTLKPDIKNNKEKFVTENFCSNWLSNKNQICEFHTSEQSADRTARTFAKTQIFNNGTRC